MKRPVLLLVIFFCAGILLARLLPQGVFYYFLGLSFLCTAGLFFSRDHFLLCACLAVLCLGFLHLRASGALSPEHLLRQQPDCYQSPCFLKGYITDFPEREGRNWKFRFCLSQVQDDRGSRSCCGKIQVSGPYPQELFYGEELIMQARLSRGGGIFFRETRAGAKAIAKTGKNRSSFVQKAAVFARRRIRDFLFSHASRPTAGIAAAMILGEKSGVDPLLTDAMTRAGTVHVLVVSGFNVGIILLAVLVILKTLRLRRRLRLGVAMLAALFYCFLTGSSSPVMRATVMAECCIGARLLKKEVDMYNCLALAALVILAGEPHQLFEIGFQLSFASVAAMVYLYPRFTRIARTDDIGLPLARLAAEGFLLSFSAWLGTAGIIAYYFKTVSPVTCLANMLIAGLASCITATAFLIAVFSFLAPGLASCMLSSLELMVFLLVKIHFFIVKIPGACFYLSCVDKPYPLC